MEALEIHQSIALEDIHSVLETRECFHLFIKGSVTRKRYQNPYYRSMGDIDFVYKETQHDKIKNALLEKDFSGYKEGRKNDIYYREPYVCVEAHRQLVPSDSSFFSYCSRIWEKVHLKKGCKYCFEMSLEDEFIFNIIHLAIHFLECGAGVRFILDVYVYNHLQMDFDLLQKELERLDLLEFYRNISDLAEYWFGQGEATPICEKLSRFVVENGTFGTSENSSGLAVRNGRFSYLRKLCFPSYK